MNEIEESRERLRSNLLQMVDLGNAVMKELDDSPVPQLGDGTIYRGLGSEGEEIEGLADSFDAKIIGNDGRLYHIKYSPVEK
ncbi:unnamed protein product [marine sediment metagenome]|uniref:Uncharacterized protein n=1 Tax=marine sediment metagenome TaxID=412755 RepID=X1FTG9_9ZZZZ